MKTMNSSTILLQIFVVQFDLDLVCILQYVDPNDVGIDRDIYFWASSEQLSCFSKTRPHNV